jgi:hypothetical protein
MKTFTDVVVSESHWREFGQTQGRAFTDRTHSWVLRRCWRYESILHHRVRLNDAKVRMTLVHSNKLTGGAQTAQLCSATMVGPEWSSLLVDRARIFIFISRYFWTL